MNLKLVKTASVRQHMDAHRKGEITYSKAVELINEDAIKQLRLCGVVGQSEQLVCEHKYQDNVCDWRGVRKCIICRQMEIAN